LCFALTVLLLFCTSVVDASCWWCWFVHVLFLLCVGATSVYDISHRYFTLVVLLLLRVGCGALCIFLLKIPIMFFFKV
jgi:hypothetical protein